MVSVDEITEMTVDICKRNLATIRACAAYGVSCEGWLKVELIRELATKYLAREDIEIKPEFRNTDIVINTPDSDLLIELKTFPTNYGSGGKPITNFIAGVAADLDKLANNRTERSQGLCIWLAYAIPVPEPTAWSVYLQRIEPKTARTVKFEQIVLWDKYFAYLYVMQSK